MLGGNESVISCVLSITSDAPKDSINGSSKAETSLTDEVSAFAILFIVYFVVLLIFEIWSFVIVVKCYKFFKDKAKYGKTIDLRFGNRILSTKRMIVEAILIRIIR